MCFRPPELNKLMSKCPACKTFNPPVNKKCKKCGADMPVEEQAEQNNPKK